jgi:hypothetical protein
VAENANAAHGHRNATLDFKEAFMDFSNMSVADWIIRTAIFGVLACVIIGTLQNIFSAIKKGGGKNNLQ